MSLKRKRSTSSMSYGSAHSNAALSPQHDISLSPTPNPQSLNRDVTMSNDESPSSPSHQPDHNPPQLHSRTRKRFRSKPDESTIHGKTASSIFEFYPNINPRKNLPNPFRRRPVHASTFLSNPNPPTQQPNRPPPTIPPYLLAPPHPPFLSPSIPSPHIPNPLHPDLRRLRLPTPVTLRRRHLHDRDGRHGRMRGIRMPILWEAGMRYMCSCRGGRGEGMLGLQDERRRKWGGNMDRGHWLDAVIGG